jgi:hypothetical protein
MNPTRLCGGIGQRKIWVRDPALMPPARLRLEGGFMYSRNRIVSLKWFETMEYSNQGRLAGILGSRIIRGALVTSVENLAEELKYRQMRFGPSNHSLLKIGNLEIPSYLENYGFFYVGSPGSGKSQTILSNVATIMSRSNFRAIIVDRNGEILEKFYDPEKFIIFNPEDNRSVLWSHRTENVDMEMIANSLIPEDNHQERFWTQSAMHLLSNIYEITQTNEAVHKLLNTSVQELSRKVPEHTWMRESERTASSVMATIKAYLGFYKYLPDHGQPFSFFEWANGNDPRSVLIPIFTDKCDRYKALLTMVIRQVLKGLICNEERRTVQTAVIIDELGALYPIKELLDLLAQGRKYKICFIGATQTLAQLSKIYGQAGLDILLQTIKTKLILNCPDYSSAEILAKCVGMQERIDIVKSSYEGQKQHYAEQIRECYAIHPTEIQQLPPLTGYVHISEGLPTAMVTITPINYPAVANRQETQMAFVHRSQPKQSHQSPINWKISNIEKYLTLYITEELLRLQIATKYIKKALQAGHLSLSLYNPRSEALYKFIEQHWQFLRNEERIKFMLAEPHRQIKLSRMIMAELISEISTHGEAEKQ